MPLLTPKPLLQAALFATHVLAGTACANAAPLSITDSGQGQYTVNSSAISELSGITYLGGDSYLAVSDNNGDMAELTLQIDRTTGQITAASVGSVVNLAGTKDDEGVAYDPRSNTVLVSEEIGNTITRHAISDGSTLGSIAVPAIYANARGNKGLESLSMEPLNYKLWTANEESLTTDGPIASATAGTIIRVQQFDADGQTSVQYGYLTDPHSGNSAIGGITSRCGVVDLIALPNDRLIVMERDLGGAIPTIRNRLYLLDTTDAADTTNIGGLNTNKNLAEKQLLYQFNAFTTNFEGAALGPMLSNGDYALVLIADNGANGSTHALLTLRLSGLAVDGDLNGDFVVDKDDLVIVLNNWGSTVTAGDRLVGDTDGDGLVGVADMDHVLAHWTTAGGSTATASVPEPGMFPLSAGLLWLLARRW